MARPPAQAIAERDDAREGDRQPDDPERPHPAMGQPDDRQRGDDRHDRDEEAAEVHPRQRRTRRLEGIGLDQHDRPIGRRDRDGPGAEPCVDGRRQPVDERAGVKDERVALDPTAPLAPVAAPIRWAWTSAIIASRVRRTAGSSRATAIRDRMAVSIWGAVASAPRPRISVATTRAVIGFVAGVDDLAEMRSATTARSAGVSMTRPAVVVNAWSSTTVRAAHSEAFATTSAGSSTTSSTAASIVRNTPPSVLPTMARTISARPLVETR